MCHLIPLFFDVISVILKRNIIQAENDLLPLKCNGAPGWLCWLLAPDTLPVTWYPRNIAVIPSKDPGLIPKQASRRSCYPLCPRVCL